MKKLLLFIAAIAILAACTKKNANDETIDKWNGYSNLKGGELVQTLWAGKTTDVGTVTYGIDDDANFYATYETIDSWVITETHFFIGDKGVMPVNKKDHPKLGHFPYKDDFNPGVTTVTYTFELIGLPPADVNGFVIAAHSVVHNTDTGDEETAWGFGDKKFSDKGWGWYTTEYFQQEDNPYYILLGTAYSGGTMTIYRIDATNETSEEFYTETFESAPDAIDGNAYDPASSNFFFTATSSGISELRVLNLLDDNPSYSAGSLDGIAASATFNDGKFYYVNETNEIIEVTLAGTDSLSIDSETTFSTIPSSITVNDIAFEPIGDHLYIIGVYQTNVELIELEVSTNTYATTTLDESVGENAQIAYGDDGTLYMIDADYSFYELQPETGVTIPIVNDSIVPVPIFDLSRGPTM